VAELFQKYNLLALPVVDFDNELKGIITVDDMLEHIPLESWRGPRGKKTEGTEHEKQEERK
jgi:Mg/Co/Ni transporter MgtE